MGQGDIRIADPGVPGALPRTLIRLRDRLGADSVDQLWIFPPVRRGRREQGLVAVSTFQEDEDRRRMVTVSYNACLLYTSPSPRDQRGSRVAGGG